MTTQVTWTGEVRSELDGAIITITLDHGARNVLNPGLMARLRQSILDADHDPATTGIVLTGAGEVFCGGLGGSMHLKWTEAGAIGTNDAVAVTYFGDGATNIGSTLETLNLAAAWDLPLCFFVENNLYAVATKVDEVTAEPRLSARGPGFGIPSWRVDGMDPLAVYLAMSEAVEHMRTGKGATLVEAEVYRYFHQNGPFPAAPSATAARTRKPPGGPATRSTWSPPTWCAATCSPRRR